MVYLGAGWWAPQEVRRAKHHKTSYLQSPHHSQSRLCSLFVFILRLPFWQPDWCTAVPPTVSSCLFAAATLDMVVLLSLLSTPDHLTAAITVAPYLPGSLSYPQGVPCWPAGPLFLRLSSVGMTVHVVSLITCLWQVMVCFPGVLGFCPPWILKEHSSQL